MLTCVIFPCRQKADERRYLDDPVPAGCLAARGFGEGEARVAGGRRVCNCKGLWSVKGRACAQGCL